MLPKSSPRVAEVIREIAKRHPRYLRVKELFETFEAYRRIGREDWLGAAVLYRKSLELDPREATSWNDLGWALAKAGFFDLALPCFERALELDPGLERAKSNLRWAGNGYPGGAAASGDVP